MPSGTGTTKTPTPTEITTAQRSNLLRSELPGLFGGSLVVVAARGDTYLFEEFQLSLGVVAAVQ